MPTFETTQAGYANMWNRCEVVHSRISDVDQAAKRIIANRSRYDAVEAKTGVPWFFIGCLHDRELSGSFRTHLHNGDSLSDSTHHVPAGRPQVGHGPPFTWEESAVDALTMPGKEYDKITDWSVPRLLYTAEGYNGWGYTTQGVNSPYVWGATSLQQPGKYIADHVWSDTAYDTQLGVAAVLKRLAALDASVAARLKIPAPVHTPAPGPPKEPQKPSPAHPPVSTVPPARTGLWGAILNLFRR